MSSPDLTIPDLEEDKPQEEEEEELGPRPDQKRMKMVQLAETGEISQGVKYIKKASEKIICRLYADYILREQEKTNAVLADTIIVKFADLLEMLDTVPSATDLAVELKEDKLLQGNVKTAITFIAPFIPFIGLITGGATVGKHVMRKKSEADRREAGAKAETSEASESQHKEADE